MAAFLTDNNCIVAALSRWHDDTAAQREIEKRLQRAEELIFAGPVLAEAFSVLTRLPRPNRISPDAASQLLLANLEMPGVRTVALDVGRYADIVRAAPREGIVGGRIHDRVILECALLAGAQTLLTFNRRHFEYLAHRRIEIVVPV